MKSVAEILDFIQVRTGKTLDEIAMDIGYSRPYLSRAKTEGSKKVELLLRSKYENVLKNQSQPIKPPDDYEAVISVLLSRVAELLALKNGSSSVVELTQMQKDVEQLKKLKS